MYDRHFRLKASSIGLKEWSSVEMNIWRMAFPDCSVLATSPGPMHYHKQGFQHPPGNQLTPMTRKICLDWNDSPNPKCIYLDCKFQHSCYRCIFNTKAADIKHKALFCPHKEKSRREPLLSAPTNPRQFKPSH